MPEFIDLSEPVTRQLEEIGHFGPLAAADGTDAQKSAFAVRLGDRPMGLNLRAIHARFGLDTSLSFFERFSSWLIPHRLAIIRRHGLSEPVSVGVEVDFDPDRTGQTRCVTALLPAPQFRVVGAAEAAFACSGAASAAGDFSQAVAGAAGQSPLVAGRLAFAPSADGKLRFDFKATVPLVTVHAGGIGAASCEWRVDRADRPLHGLDLEFWSALVFPKWEREIHYQIRFYIVHRTLFVPTRWQSGWQKLQCPLEELS